MNYTRHNSNDAKTLGAANRGIKLVCVTVNTKGSAANTLTIADANGTVAVIDTVNINSQSLIYGCDLKGPVTFTMATGGAADVTYLWQ